MARIRKINVSQVEGNNNGVLPAGTIVAYDNGGAGYILRVHNGVTEGGVSLNAGQTPVIFNGTDGIVVGNLNEGIAALFNNGDVYITGGESLRFTGLDNIEGESSAVLRFWNGEGRYSLDDDATELVTLNVGNDADEGTPTLGFFKIITEKQVGGEKEWKFDADGALTLPTGGDILDSNGNSVLGGGAGDQNIWVQTFASDTPVTDQVQIATSVEYDADGNIFALFSHYENSPPEASTTYASVAKLSPTGTIIWQVRFAANLNTDGWGLAYDGEDSVYVAGSTSGTPLTYDFATLTKIDAISGTIVWSKTYDFEANSQSAVVDVDSDSNPIMVGYANAGTDNMIITTKVDQADGTVIWSKTLDGQGDDEAYGMAVGPTGEVVTIGYTDTFGVQNAADNLYADLEGNLNWTVGGSINFDGVTADFTFAAGIPTFTNIVDTVGGREVDDVLGTVLGSTIGGADGTDDMVVKVETTAANDTVNRMVVVKYAANGTIAWQKAVQFDANEDCSGADADIDADGNIYVCGNHNTGIGSAMSLVKFNSSGVEQWSRRVVGDCADFATSVVVGPDNNLYLSGVTTTPMAETVRWVVAKYSTTGSVVWQRLIENTASWTFTGSLFFENAGGSNIAVGPDYVALAGGFGTFENDEDPTATVVQIDTNGTLFSIGDWALTAASFTGNLDDSASDITVVNAGKTAGTATPAVADFNGGDDDSNFLIGTLYNAPGGNDSLVNGEYSVILGNTGTVTLPSGGTISEGYVTSNPTIQLTPASPDVASQKLVIKGGGGQYYNLENGIQLGTDNNVWAVSDSATFYVYSETRADETLYWWIVPEGAGISTTMSGTVELDEFGAGVFNFTVISDAYEFRVRVSPEEDNYDPESIGVESVLINGDAPAYGDYHLHLTTGDLEETSIFLGTDDHNVRTTTDRKIQITTPNDVNNVWEFGADGVLTFPSGNLSIGNAFGSDSIVGSTGTIVAVVAQGQYGGASIQWIDNIENIGSTSTQTQVAGVVVNNPLASTTGTVQIVTGFVSTATTATSVEHTWTFGTDGGLTFPDGQSIIRSLNVTDGIPGLTLFAPERIYLGIASSSTSWSWDFRNYGQNDYSTDKKPAVMLPGGSVIEEDLTNQELNNGMAGPLSISSQDKLTLRTNNLDDSLTPEATYDWVFGNDGDLTLPAGGNIVDSTGVNQTAQRVEGTWTVTTGTNTYNFTVPMDGTYVMWVKGNIPNGIITWNATVSVSNSNVPAIGTQYAWNYTGGGSPILLTAMPDQIRGTTGTISTDATYAGTTSNRFDFTIANTSGEAQTVYYGYTKV